MKRILVIVVLLSSAAVHAQVSYDRLLRSGAEPHNWLTYSERTRAIVTARSRRSPRKTSVISSSSGSSGLARSKFEATPCHRRRDVPCSRRMTSSRSMRQPDGSSGCLASAVAAGEAVLRPRQPRAGDSRQHAVHGDDRWPSRGRRREKRTSHLGCCAGAARGRLQPDAGPWS